jgi:hypothetical protein
MHRAEKEAWQRFFNPTSPDLFNGVAALCRAWPIGLATVRRKRRFQRPGQESNLRPAV